MFDIGNGPAGRADGVIVGGEAQQAVSTTPANAAASPDIQQTRWRIDPQRSSVEFRVRKLCGDEIRDEAAGRYGRALAALILVVADPPPAK